MDRIAGTFIGKTKQRPSIYSAIRVNGRRAYELARKDRISAEMMPFRDIFIYNLCIKWLNNESETASNAPRLEIVVKCKSGLFVRTLAEDIAKSLGTVGHTREIQRLSIGPYSLSEIEESNQLLSIPGSQIKFKVYSLQETIDRIPTKKVVVSLKDEMKWREKHLLNDQIYSIYRSGNDMKTNNLPYALVKRIENGEKILQVTL